MIVKFRQGPASPWDYARPPPLRFTLRRDGGTVTGMEKGWAALWSPPPSTHRMCCRRRPHKSALHGIPPAGTCASHHKALGSGEGPPPRRHVSLPAGPHSTFTPHPNSRGTGNKIQNPQGLQHTHAGTTALPCTTRFGQGGSGKWCPWQQLCWHTVGLVLRLLIRGASALGVVGCA